MEFADRTWVVGHEHPGQRIHIMTRSSIDRRLSSHKCIPTVIVSFVSIHRSAFRTTTRDVKPHFCSALGTLHFLVYTKPLCGDGNLNLDTGLDVDDDLLDDLGGSVKVDET